jgi:carbon storage regulator CsrA|tara:strand:- start:374 stop:562 length:189 start_codon:yes stop_codon:yes gene_type:complete
MPRLVLTRKVDEQVIIHDKGGVLATVKISKVDRNQVRITFEANEEIKIDRQEIFDKTLPLHQ